MALPLVGAALVSGGLSSLGGIFSNRSSAKRAREAMAFEERQAQKQMDFQERMSSTAHQREVADMRAAGLNPILSATGGPGSSSPSGASGSGAVADVENVLSEATNTGLAAMQNRASLKLIGAQMEDVINAARLKDAQRRQVEATTEGIDADNVGRRNQAEFESRSLGSLFDKAFKEWEFGDIKRVIDSVLGGANSARSLMR